MNQNPSPTIYDEWFRNLFTIEPCRYVVEYYAKGLKRLVIGVSKYSDNNRTTDKVDTYISFMGVGFAQFVPSWEDRHIQIANLDKAPDFLVKYGLEQGKIKYVLFTSPPVPVMIGCSSLVFSTTLPDDFTAFNKNYTPS